MHGLGRLIAAQRAEDRSIVILKGIGVGKDATLNPKKTLPALALPTWLRTALVAKQRYPTFRMLHENPAKTQYLTASNHVDVFYPVEHTPVPQSAIAANVCLASR